MLSNEEKVFLSKSIHWLIEIAKSAKYSNTCVAVDRVGDQKTKQYKQLAFSAELYITSSNKYYYLSAATTLYLLDNKTAYH